MFRKAKKTSMAVVALMSVISLNMFVPLASVRAADHAESLSVAGDPGADLGDAFVYLNPNDNTKVILALTVSGFIVPSEQLNLGFFAPDILYRFEIENTGDAIADSDGPFKKQYESRGDVGGNVLQPETNADRQRREDNGDRR